MPRFVLLFHDCSEVPDAESHWDLMLEQAGVLLTWRLRQLPDQWHAAAPGETPELTAVAAQRLPDHRIAYLDYEGPITGNRGQVSRWDHGHYSPLEESNGVLRVELVGQRVRATIELPTDPPPPQLA